ncbi:hypothetical protein C5167_005675 [Papaver somniferum]|uniref:Uncharacterized protein n=1 Tax=Papaver somniferum TaxID=3469 RepID=A0A4Y7JEB1_PAPSO|nr:hypothetical protein C5167_005675 [Papaver somniferum]
MLVLLVLASVWTEEKWLQTFSGLRTFAIRVVYFSICIILLGLLVKKIHHPSPSCLVGSDQNDAMFIKGAVSMMLLNLPPFIVLSMNLGIRGLPALQLARSRLRLNAGYFLCTIIIVLGVTFTGLAMMDLAQFLFGLWRCHAPFTIAFMVLSAFFTVIVDGYLLRSTYYVISTP